MKAKNSIRYDLLTRESLRSVIRKSLRQVQLHGLPSDHHFYITFKTTGKGVMISPWLQEKYPDHMTIVLQHQFSELKVTDTAFSVRLHFNHIPETLSIPLSAILAFYDPSVEFALQFDKVMEEDASAVLSPGIEKKESDLTPEQYQETSENAEAEEQDEKIISLDAFRQRGSA